MPNSDNKLVISEQRGVAPAKASSIYNSPIFAFRSLLIYRLLVGRVIPDSKKEPRVNRGLLRNCNSAPGGKARYLPLNEDNAFAI